MKRSTRTKTVSRATETVATPEPVGTAVESDDELEIRFSLTALGELAVAHGDTRGRGRRFRGFGPCGAVA